MKKLTVLFSFRLAALSLVMVFGILFSSVAYGASTTSTWNGSASDGLWATAANWTPSGVPGTNSDVIIPATFTVTLASTPASKINSLSVLGKLIINASVTLNVEQISTLNPIVSLGGGQIENSGTLSIKQTLTTSANSAIYFQNGLPAPTTNAKLINTGTLTIDMGNTSGITSTASRIIYFNQNTATTTSQFNVGGTLNLTNIPAAARLIELASGLAEIDGTQTFGSAGTPLNARFLHAGANGTLTFLNTANITINSGFTNANGVINMSNTGTVSYINNGTLTLHGLGASPLGAAIDIQPQATAGVAPFGTSTFTNTGTITVDGNWPLGAIYMNGNNASCTANLNNNSGATLSLTNTNAGTSGAAIRASLTPVNLITNAGTLSLSTALATSMLFGDNSSTLNNTGTVTVDKAITGITTNATAGIINNNAGGIFNFNVADNTTAAVINTNKIIFNNNGGTVKGRGVFSTGTFTQSASGTLDPGVGAGGIGSFTISETPFTLAGNCFVKVNNKTTAGADFDQIIGGGTLNLGSATLTATIDGGYTPVGGDLISVITAPTISGALTLNALTNWSMSYVATDAKLLYTEPAASYAIAATVAGGGGSVTGTGTITTGGTATLTASKSGYTFLNWTEGGSVVSTSNPYIFTVVGPRTLVANYIHEISWDGGAGDGLWSSPTNWSSDVTPIATDMVTIPAGNTVTVSSDAGKVNKLSVLGRLDIDAAGTLVVEQGIANGSSIVEVGGGEIHNAGIFTITQLLSSTSAGLSLINGTDADSKFYNTGTLTINVAFGSSTGACVRFNQTTASRTAQLILGGTVNLSNNAGQHYFNVLAGQASIDGTAVIGSSAPDYRNNKLIHIVDGTLTLALGANITYYSGFVNADGAITVANATSGGLTNNGSLTIHQGSAVTGSAIYLYPQASATATLTNAGAITIDGVSPIGQLNISGLNATSTANFNNQTGATISITNTHASAAALLASATPIVALTNNGTISLAVPTTSRAMYFGGLTATFTNNGILNSNGAITGNDAVNASVFNNTATGVYNANVALDTYVAISNNKKFTFNNHGLITGKGIFGSGTLNTLDGTLSPGIAGGIGLFRVYQNPYVLTGNYIMQVNGTAVAGTDYDQILVSSAALTGSFSIDETATINVTTGGGYTPVQSDQVALMLGGLSRTGNSFTTGNITLPTSNWLLIVDATAVYASYDPLTVGVQSNSALKGKVYANAQHIYVALDGNATTQFQLVDLTGRIVKQANMNGQNNKVNVANLKGIFVVRLITKDRIYSQKVSL